jgi:lipopolysaccharide export system protein LptA
MRYARALFVAACLAAGPGVSPAEAQAGACQLVESQTLQRRTDGAFQTIHIIVPVVSCTGGARISSSEGTLYEATREIHLFGNVVFTDPDRRLTSNQATYSSVTGRLYATGNVVFTDLVEGMTLRGPELEYFRAMPGRPQSQAIATQRPHLTLLPRAQQGSERPADAEPVEIDADRMVMIGNEQYNATGNVEIRRSDFQAFSREARVDQVANRMDLRGNARIQGEQYDLSGEMIDLLMPGDRLERIIAQQRAELVGEDLRLDAPDIRLFFTDDLLQRMTARRGSTEGARPVATARGFRLEADSIDAQVPGQQLDQVVAIGNARGESLDTTAVPAGRIAAAAPAGELTAADRDWILGDTVTGFFVAANGAAADTVAGTAEARNEMTLERVLAVGSARSLYRVESNDPDAPQQRPGLNYIVGEAIALKFSNGEIDVADVRGLQRGLFLDPEPPPAPAEEPPVPAAEAATGGGGNSAVRG